MHRSSRIVALIGALFAACSAGIPGAAAGPAALDIRSPAFADGATIPRQYTCEGADRSPPLAWSGAPGGISVLALIVEDPDAPGGSFIHWVAFNLPPDSTGLAVGVPGTASLAAGGEQGVNDFGKLGYAGPCPPPGRPHHYHFRLFALDQPVALGREATAAALRNAMQGHVKAGADLVGVFAR